jgi:hypothetical protein
MKNERKGDWLTVTRPSSIFMNSLSEAKFCRTSRSVERLIRIVRASLAICLASVSIRLLRLCEVDKPYSPAPRASGLLLAEVGSFWKLRVSKENKEQGFQPLAEVSDNVWFPQRRDTNQVAAPECCHVRWSLLTSQRLGAGPNPKELKGYLFQICRHFGRSSYIFNRFEIVTWQIRLSVLFCPPSPSLNLHCYWLWLPSFHL